MTSFVDYLYTVIDPAGEPHRIVNVRQFCDEHGLDSGNMYRVIMGVRKHCGGFTCPEAGYIRTYSKRARR